MGQLLSSPITTKHSTEGKNDSFMFGASSMQGWRITMEDAHTHILNYKDTEASFFAVFDGHGGQNVAKYSSEKLPGIVMESKDFKNGDYKEALRKGFFQIDTDLLNDKDYQNESSGCTAIVALITKDNTLYISNAGDSRAIISTKGMGIALSQDHKPTNHKEKERIQQAGGHVEFGRVNGNLALSRALGDFEFKKAANLPPEKQAVTADPDITVHKITDKDEFMVLACDGIWDCVSNQEAATFIRKEIMNNVPLKEICERLMDHCLADNTSGNAGIGCDNMTVEIVAFLNGKTEEEWYASIRGDSAGQTKQEVYQELKQTPSELPSESRQYSMDELKQAPDLTSSLLNKEKQ